MEATAEITAAVKNVPALRFPEFDGEWAERRLGDLSKLITKGTTPNSFSDEGINYVKIEALEGININKDKCLYIDASTHNKELKRSILQKDDLLFAIAGATIGKVAIVTDNILPANTNQALAIVRLKNTDTLPYVLQLLQSRVMKKYIYQNLSVGAQPNLNLEQINNFTFHLPTLPEQQKIASFLTIVDDKIQQFSKKKELLEKYKKGVMQQLFSQQIRFKDDNGNDFPEWEIKKAKDVFKNHSNKKHNGDLPILAITQDKGTVLRDSIDIDIKSSEASIKSYKIIEAGDFIISLRSFQGGIEYSDITGICSPAYTILKATIDIDTTFFKYYFKKESFIKQLSNTVVGIRDGKQISYDAFSGMKLVFPSVAEQAKIGKFLTSIDNKINYTFKQLEQAQQFKKGLLQQMFV